MPLKRQSSTNSGVNEKHAALFKSLNNMRVEGRAVIELFTEIPDANMYPDYRDVVDTPVSLAEIGKRIRAGAYESDDALVADFALMAENAKSYNGEESPVYDDAIDILDYVLLYLGREPSRTTRLQLQTQVLNELENYKYKGRQLSDAFIVEPDTKTYPNYLDIVKHPTSFTKVRKTLAENGPAASWSAFRELVGQIFANAMLYNQEESVIYNDAKALTKQLDNKIKKHSQIPRHLATALEQADTSSLNVNNNARSSSRGHSRAGSDSESGNDGSDGEGSDNQDGSDDQDDDDDEEDDEEEPQIGAPRYEDDDDEDFEADSEDMDEEDFREGDQNGEGQENREGAEQGGIMPDGGPIPPQFMQPITIYDEIVYRPPDEGVEDALLQMVTCHSTPIPPQLAMNLPIEDVKRAENDTLQLRIPPSPSKAFTTYATTLPYYQYTLRLSVLPNRRIQPLQLAVLLNGAKLMALPSLTPQPQWENFELTLAPGLNQVTIIAIKPTYGGFMRQFGPPPLADAEPDEERMVLFLNLSK